MDTRPGVRPDPRKNGQWQVRFRVEGKQYTKSAASQREANRRMDAIEERKALVKSRKIAIPLGVDVGEWFFTDGQGGLAIDRKAAGAGLIGDLIEDYLTQRRLEVQAQQLSQASYASDKYRLAAFLEFCKKKKKTAVAGALAPEHLDGYRNHLLGQIGHGKLAAVSVKHALRTVKAMLLWAYEKEKVDQLPRVLNKYASVTLPAPAPRFFTIAEIKSLYGAATPRMKLLILLGLNCGYTQADIASLEHSHIDWKNGMIIRERHKTGQPQEHKLWPRTIALLKEHATKPGQRNPDLLLVGEEGNPLVSEKITDTGAPYKVDAIRLAFDRLLRRCGIDDGRGFALFRKTGADAIAKQYQAMPHLTDLYLAHSPKGMKTHYARQHYDELHKATDWLSTVYGFDKAAD